MAVVAVRNVIHDNHRLGKSRGPSLRPWACDGLNRFRLALERQIDEGKSKAG
jgi:hypothetical protein